LKHDADSIKNPKITLLLTTARVYKLTFYLPSLVIHLRMNSRFVFQSNFIRDLDAEQLAFDLVKQKLTN